jgi:hypothetical protein
MAHYTLKDNLIRLQQYPFEYLKKRVAEWELKNLKQPDSNGCCISRTVSTAGYARITLRQTKKEQWHAPAYTVIAFVQKLTPDPATLNEKEIASHLCNRGHLGCAEVKHISFESQAKNMDRKNKRCYSVATCSTCYTLQVFGECKGHGIDVPLCNIPTLHKKARELRLIEIDEAISKLEKEKQQLLKNC